ncbi:MAG: response regulator [Elusimicrobiota bacterium]
MEEYSEACVTGEEKPSSAMNAGMKRILVVEDEGVLNSIYVSELREDGYTVIPALDGQTALGHLENNRIDLVVLDMKLPDMSGAEVFNALKKKLPAVPVIICSAYDPEKNGFENVLSEKTEYMIKPVVLEKLKRKIKILLEAQKKAL